MRWNLLDKATWAIDVPDETMMMATSMNKYSVVSCPRGANYHVTHHTESEPAYSVRGAKLKKKKKTRED